MREIALFGEDRAHQLVVGALLRRLAEEQRVEVPLAWRQAYGGHGRMKHELNDYLRALHRHREPLPDLIGAATDANCKGLVKKADQPGAQLTVSEFLREVRRLVVDFVVGRVLSHDSDPETAGGLDDVTTYYLLHRNGFGVADAPIGACILCALPYNISDRDLTDRFDILPRSGGSSSGVSEDEIIGNDMDAETEAMEDGTGSQGNMAKLKPCRRRTSKSLGYETPGGRPVPLIDRAHRLMQLWNAGNEAKVNDYLDRPGLKRNALFTRLLQALIELAPTGSEERAILESVSNHIATRDGVMAARQTTLQLEEAS